MTRTFRAFFPTPWILVVLIHVADGLPATGEGMTGSETSADQVESHWIVSTPKPAKNELFNAWLIIMGKSKYQEVRVLLHPNTAIESWFPASSEACAVTPDNERRISQTFADAGERSEVLHVCARAVSEQPSRMIAVLQKVTHGPIGSFDNVEIQVVASEPLDVQPTFIISPLTIAFLTALLGFLGGVCTHLLQKAWERRGEKQDLKVKLAELIAKHVLPELRDNYGKLHAYNSGLTPTPPDLQVEGYNRALLADGALGYLNSDERRAYLAWLQELYNLSNSYQSAVNRRNQSETRRLASVVEAKLSERLS